MLLNLGASTFLFSIVSNNFNSFNNTRHKPVVEAGVAVLRSTLRCQVSVRIMPQVFYARRNRRNSPSMARFLLASASMPRHFCALKHNSTDTKQLRYSPARQHCLPHHRLTPLTLSYNVPVLTWVRTARRSQPALLPTRHNKFAGEYVVCSEENYELPRGSIFPINTKNPGISTIYPHMGSWLTS